MRIPIYISIYIHKKKHEKETVRQRDQHRKHKGSRGRGDKRPLLQAYMCIYYIYIYIEGS